MKTGPIGFVIVGIDGDTPEVLSERVRVVVETAQKHAGTIDSIGASMVIITYGVFPDQSPDRNSSTLVHELVEQLGPAIKIVHGVRSAVYGNLGGSNRLHFGAIISGFQEVLEYLSTLDFGQVTESPLPNA